MAAGALFSGTMLLTGCGIGGSGGVGVPSAIATAGHSTSGLNGILHGGPNPVSGANVILWATQSNGYPSSSNATSGTTSLQLASTTTNSAGSFSFTPGSYTCPSGQFVYITATGGNSTNGVTLGGQSFDASVLGTEATNGVIQGNAYSEVVVPSSNVYTFAMPVTSAVLLTVPHF